MHHGQINERENAHLTRIKLDEKKVGAAISVALFGWLADFCGFYVFFFYMLADDLNLKKTQEGGSRRRRRGERGSTHYRLAISFFRTFLLGKAI